MFQREEGSYRKAAAAAAAETVSECIRSAGRQNWQGHHPVRVPTPQFECDWIL